MCRRIAWAFVLDFWKSATRFLPLLLKFQGTHRSDVLNMPTLPRCLGILVIALPCEELVVLNSQLSNLTSAIICYFILISATFVVSSSFHRPFAPWMIFQGVLSKLKLYSQFCHAELSGTLSSYAPTIPLWISLSFSPSFEDFDYRLIDLCYNFLEVDSLFRVPCIEEKLHPRGYSHIKTYGNVLPFWVGFLQEIPRHGYHFSLKNP